MNVVSKKRQNCFGENSPSKISKRDRIYFVFIFSVDPKMRNKLHV